MNIPSCQTLQRGICASLGQVSPLKEFSRLRGTLSLHRGAHSPQSTLIRFSFYTKIWAQNKWSTSTRPTPLSECLVYYFSCTSLVYCNNCALYFPHTFQVNMFSGKAHMQYVCTGILFSYDLFRSLFKLTIGYFFLCIICNSGYFTLNVFIYSGYSSLNVLQWLLDAFGFIWQCIMPAIFCMHRHFIFLWSVQIIV